MTVRPLMESDGPAMLAFFDALPEEETTFLKGEQVKSSSISDWTGQDTAIRLVSVRDDGEIIGYAAICPGVGMSAHVGDIRLIVATSARGHGIGLELARKAMIEGFSTLGLAKLSVEVVAEEQGIIRMFSRLGFTPEALLRDHLRDQDGNMRDLVLLCHLAEDGWADFETLGLSGTV